MSTLFGKRTTTTSRSSTSSRNNNNNNNKRKNPIDDTEQQQQSVDDDDDNVLLEVKEQDKAKTKTKKKKTGGDGRLKLQHEASDDDDDDHDHDDDDDTSTDTSTSLQQYSYSYDSTKTFHDLGLDDPLIHVCTNIVSYKKPTPVQQVMIPYILQKHQNRQQQRQRQHHQRQQQQHICCNVTAATGSGKTASYILPILQCCSIDPTTIYAIIITPTRELAIQIHQQCTVFSKVPYNNTIQCTCMIGGMDIVQQGNLLYNNPPHILITTPGRLSTILQNAYPPKNIHKISFLIIDEADRLLPNHYIQQIQSSNNNSDRNCNSNSNSNNANCGFIHDMDIIFQHIYPTSNMTTTATATTTNPIQQQQQQQQYRSSIRLPHLLLYSATCTKQNDITYQQIVNKYISSSLSSSMSQKKNYSKIEKIIISQDYNIEQVLDDDDDNVDNGNGNHRNNNDTSSNHDATNNSTTTASAAIAVTTKINYSIPNGLKQEYIFVPAQIRDTYLVTIIRHLIAYGGNIINTSSSSSNNKNNQHKKIHHKSKQQQRSSKGTSLTTTTKPIYDDEIEQYKAQSAIIFVATCERAAFVTELFKQMGVYAVTLHSYLTQNQRRHTLHIYQSQQSRILIATDIASRGLDIPRTDLVINAELDNIIHDPTIYIHRIGRTARAGRRGRAINIVTENDVQTIQTIEQTIFHNDTTKKMDLCLDITDEMAIPMLSVTVKAARLAKLQLHQNQFYELVDKMKERKIRDKKLQRQQQQRLNR